MATITPRKRADGSMSYRASIRLKKDGAIVHQEAQTFDQRRMAEAWAKKREVELQAPGAIAKARGGPTVGDLVDWYVEEYGKGFRRTKMATLLQLGNSDLASEFALQLTAARLIDHIKGRRLGTAGPATAANDLIWLRVLFKAARPALSLDLNLAAIEDAFAFCRTEKLVARAQSRSVRPTDKQIESLEALWARRDGRASIPMTDIMQFAIHSARRVSEITQLRWEDNNEEHCTGIVRDLKHPTKKDGNHQTFKYTVKGWEIVQRQPKISEFIFPYNSRSISTNFAGSCQILEIKDLTFHDLRHHATSLLFEAGYSIVEVQQFTLHESWNMLKRYTNLRPKDIKLR